MRFINIVIGAWKSVCHTQKSYVFPSAAATPPQWEILLFLFQPYSPVLHNGVVCQCYPPIPLPPFPSPLYRAPHFLFSLSLSFSRLFRFRGAFSLLSPPPPPRPARHTLTAHSSILLFHSFSRRGNRLSLRRTCSHSSGTIERKRGRKRYFSRTVRTSASAVNSGPNRGENFAKYRSNASRAFCR